MYYLYIVYLYFYNEPLHTRDVRNWWNEFGVV